MSLLASLLSIAVILLRSGPAHANSLEELKNLSIAELLQVRIITASKVSEPLFKSTSDVTVFTSADIKRSGARSYHDLLMKVPGFIFNRTHSYAGAATVRGADATRILTLIDGHVLNEPEKGSAMNAFIDTLPVENIKRIEVIKGPGSALYGANAFLGIIHIITKDADDVDGVEASAGIEFESDHFVGRKYNLLAGHRFNDDVGLSLNLNWLDHDGPELAVGADAFGHAGKAFAGREQFDLQLGLELGELHLRGRYFHNEREGFFGLLNVLADGSKLLDRGGHMEVQWTHEFLEDLELKVLAYGDHVDLDHYFVAFEPGTVPAGHPDFSPWNATGLVGNPQLAKTVAGTEVQSTYRGWNRNIFVAGATYRHERQDNPKVYSNSNPAPLPTVQDVSDTYNWMSHGQRDIVSAYLQDIFDITDDIRLNAGVRVDHFSDFGTTWNPRIGVHWKLSEQFDFKTSYGTAFRAPSFGALYVKNNPAFLGNPDLHPEKIQTFQARISFNHEDLFLGDVTYYHSELEDLIVPRPGQTGLNLGEITINGVEVQGRYYFREFAYASAYYAMNDPDSNRPPRHTIGADLNLVFWEKFNWNVDLIWRDEQQRAATDSRASLDDYIVVNTTLLLASFWKDHELSFSVYNLFDKGYAYAAPAKTYPDDYTAPGRSFSVELRLKF